MAWDLDKEARKGALYGDIRALKERASVNFTISTEPENASGHGIWFNRGAIASHALSTQFQDKKISPARRRQGNAHRPLTTGAMVCRGGIGPSRQPGPCILYPRVGFIVTNMPGCHSTLAITQRGLVQVAA
jgi:hypothetical protein